MSRCWYCECGNQVAFGEYEPGIELYVEPFFGRWVIRVVAKLNSRKAMTARIPVSHCPFCGRSLKDETPPELYIGYRTKRHSRSWRSDADERDVSFDGEETTSETSGAVARTLLEGWEDMA